MRCILPPSTPSTQSQGMLSCFGQYFSRGIMNTIAFLYWKAFYNHLQTRNCGILEFSTGGTTEFLEKFTRVWRWSLQQSTCPGGGGVYGLLLPNVRLYLYTNNIVDIKLYIYIWLVGVICSHMSLHLIHNHFCPVYMALTITTIIMWLLSFYYLLLLFICYYSLLFIYHCYRHHYC